MKTNKTVLAGGVVALLGAGLLALFVAQAAGKAGAEEPTAVAYVVTERLRAGTDVDGVRERVRETMVPESLAAEGRVTDFAAVEGKKLVRPVGEGEILHTDQFASAGPVSGGLVVPAGYEAITLEAEPAPGVEGYVTPGSRVNVYATVAGGDTPDDLAAPAGGDQSYTQLVLGHLDVLAVTRGTLTGESKPAEEEGEQGRIVLLLQVRPEDAPVLVHAQSKGSLWFTLVNPDDAAPPARRVRGEDFDPGRRTQAINEARSRQDATAISAQESQ